MKATWLILLELQKTVMKICELQEELCIKKEREWGE